MNLHPTLHIPHPSIAEAMARLIHVVIEPLYLPLSPLAKLMQHRPPGNENHRPLANTTNFKLSYFDHTQLLCRRHSSNGFKFFYDDWRTGIPRYEDKGMIMKLLRLLLTYVGPHLNRDPRLMGKLIRVGRHLVSQVRSFVP
jgi:THO complex subunit 2